MKPAAMLVAPLEIEISRVFQLGILLQYRRKTDAGVEPDVEDMLLARPFLCLAVRTRVVRREQGFVLALIEPEIGAIFFKPGSRCLDQVWIQDDARAFPTAERDDRHAPASLPRQTDRK